MDYRQRMELVRRISSGKLKAKVNWDSEDLIVEIFDPNISILLEADFVYKTAYDKMIEDEVMSLEQSYKLLEEEGKWSSKQDLEIFGIKDEIEKLKEVYPKLQYRKAEQRSVLASIGRGEKKLKELNDTKNQYFEFTAEYLSERAKRHFIFKNCCKLENEELLKDQKFLDVICYYYFGEYFIDSPKIRELARSDPWRLYWSLSKDTGTPLFDCPAVEITEYQYALVSWSKIYDYAYESSERPSEETISNDDAFDLWYDSQANKMKEENKKRDYNQQFLSKSNTGILHQQIFIPADAEGAKEVFELNDVQAKGMIRQRQNQLKEKGEIKEHEFKDVQMDLRMAAAQLERQKVLKGK